MARGDPNMAPVGIDFINRFYKTGAEDQMALHDFEQRSQANQTALNNEQALRPYKFAADKATQFGNAFKETLPALAYGVAGPNVDAMAPFGVRQDAEGNLVSGQGAGQVNVPLPSYLQEATANSTLALTHGRTPTGAHTSASVGGIDFGFGGEAAPGGTPPASAAPAAGPAIGVINAATAPAAAAYNAGGAGLSVFGQQAPTNTYPMDLAAATRSTGLSEQELAQTAATYGLTMPELAKTLAQRAQQHQELTAPAAGPPDYGNVPVGGGPAPEVQAAPGAERWQSLLAPQMGVESSGNPHAVSPRGAMGPFQFEPSTYQEVAKKYGLPPEGIFDKKTAGKAASLYMGDLEKQFAKHGPKAPLYALMAYNWGPGEVNKWIKEGADPGRMPVETARYVERLAPYLPQALPMVAN